MAKLVIIGIGYKPLDSRARQTLAATDYILGSRRLCEVFEGYPEHKEWGHKVKRIDSVDGTMEFIREALATSSADVVLLGSGDPLFYGIGGRAVREFGKDNVEIVPDMTSLQMAFSRIGEPWDYALFISFHGGPNPAKRRHLKYGMRDLPALLADNDLIGILTDNENEPAAIARFLRTSYPEASSLRFYVGEKMGYPDERITEGTSEEIGAKSFVHPNVVIIKKTNSPERAESFPIGPFPSFGLREDEFSHSRGLITKDEVRAVTIHSLRLPATGVFWDIGSGSGSVAVEVARLCPGLDVYAIEKNEEQLSHIKNNGKTFAAPMHIVAGEAPSALEALPAPDRVFVGGSGGMVTSVIQAVSGRMDNGIMVVNAVTVETLSQAAKALEAAGFRVRTSQVSVARSKSVGTGSYLSGLNPVFIVTGER